MSFESFGTDITLKDGDLISTAGGDIYTNRDYEFSNKSKAKFEGYFNILFALTDRLLTLKGDFVFYPDYGSELFGHLSRPNSASLKRNIDLSVRESLLEDTRVKSVKNVVVEQNGSFVNIKAYVVLVGEDTISEFVFPQFVVE